MDLTLLSGVVRNRKMAGAVSRASALFNDGSESPQPPPTFIGKMWDYVGKNAICRKFKLRVHKFKFQWDLVLHLSICMGSLFPFTVTGNRHYTWFPIVVWAFYNSLILMGPRYANSVIPGFSKLQHNFKVTMEEFFAPFLLPMLSISFLLVALSLVVTGHRLGGPPLCFQPCGQCLALWSNGIQMSDLSEDQLKDYDPYRKGCGYANGKELLSYYTMAQISFLLFVTVVVAMSVCLGWKLAAEEMKEFRDGEEWLKKQDAKAFELREDMLKRFGSPASSIRPEGSAAWVLFGINAALSFALLGWHNWYVLPPSNTATLLIMLNLATMIMTLLILHLGFFGRLLALYKRNFLRVEYLTVLLGRMQESDIDCWWNCRNFVLNDDLSLDYDIGGLAVSVTFLISLLLFLTFCRQMISEGFNLAITESPGGYCAYAVMYLVSCLIKLFTYATKTYEEQHRHIDELMKLSNSIYHRTRKHHGDGTPLANPNNNNNSNTSTNLNMWQVEEEDYLQLRDDGPIDIDDSSTDAGDNEPLLDTKQPRKFSNVFSPKAKRLTNSFSNSGGGGNMNFMDTIANTSNKESGGSSNSPISSPVATAGNGGAAATSLIYGSRSISNADLIHLSAPNNNNNNNNNIESGTGGGGMKSALSSNRLSLDIPLVESDIENSIVKSPSVVPATSSNLTSGQLPRPLAIPERPTLQRAESTGTTAAEGYRQTISEIMSQIRKYDPYPCILGIPIMPSLFDHSKFYIYLAFNVLGARAFMLCMNEIGWGSGAAVVAATATAAVVTAGGVGGDVSSSVVSGVAAAAAVSS